MDACHALRVLAPAKINLFLHVGERRQDGYHALESLVVFAQAGDVLELRHAEQAPVLSVTGPFADRLGPGDNLVMRCARALGGRGADIRLEKNLPVAAGLGGGSADAGAALRGLNLLWGLRLGDVELQQVAASLGSDVPACLLSQPCFMEGRGERVSLVPALPPFPLVLVNPMIAVPTAAVFAQLNARSGVGNRKPPLAAFRTVWDLIAYLEDAANDLEAPAGRLVPVIEDVLAALDREPGCVLAQMSGSGATCFGLFEQEAFALGAAGRIGQDHPEWWVKATRIASPAAGKPQRLSSG